MVKPILSKVCYSGLYVALFLWSCTPTGSQRDDGGPADVFYEIYLSTVPDKVDAARVAIFSDDSRNSSPDTVITPDVSSDSLISVNLKQYRDKSVTIDYTLFTDSRVVAKQRERLTVTGKNITGATPDNIPRFTLPEEMAVSEAGRVTFTGIWNDDSPEENLSLLIDCMGSDDFIKQDPDDAWCDFTEEGTFNTVLTLSDGMHTITDTVSIEVQFENLPPTASSVEINGTGKADKLLRADYIYEDPEGDEEGASLFQWYRDDTRIPEATASEYTCTLEDTGSEITVGIIAVAKTGTSPGDEIVSEPLSIHGYNPPVASSLKIDGALAEGATLVVEYEYTDADNDPEGQSAIQWYRDSIPIDGATDSSYAIVPGDKGALLSVGVTPVSRNTDEQPGKEVIIAAADTVRGFHAPVASDVAIIRYQTGSPFEVSYTYADADSDTEGQTKFTWYSNGSIIENAAADTYSPSQEYAWTYLQCGVTPVSAHGDIVEGEMQLSDSLLCVFEEKIMENDEVSFFWEFQEISGEKYANRSSSGATNYYDGQSVTTLEPGIEIVSMSETVRIWKKDNELILSSDNQETSIGTFYRFNSRIAHSGRSVAFSAKKTETSPDTFYYYNGTTLQEIMPPVIDGYLNIEAITDIDISGSDVVWKNSYRPTMGIYLYNGSTVERLSELSDHPDIINADHGDCLKIMDNKIVWIEPVGSDNDIFLYDEGTISRLTDNDVDESRPQFYGNNIIWEGFDGHDIEIYLYNGTEVIQITDNEEIDYNVHVSGNLFIWQRVAGPDDGTLIIPGKSSVIHLYNGDKTFQLTTGMHIDVIPVVSEAMAVWSRPNFGVWKVDLSNLP